MPILIAQVKNDVLVEYLHTLHLQGKNATLPIIKPANTLE